MANHQYIGALAVGGFLLGIFAGSFRDWMRHVRTKSGAKPPTSSFHWNDYVMPAMLGAVGCPFIYASAIVIVAAAGRGVERAAIVGLSLMLALAMMAAPRYGAVGFRCRQQ